MPRPSARHRARGATRRPAQSAAPPPPPGRPPAPGSFDVGWVLLPLRLFLGATFVYAGFQKVFDAGFFKAGSRTFIGAQLQGFGSHSPIGGLLDWLGTNLPIEVGLFVIAVELAVGVAVLIGYRTRAFAAAGAALNLLLFLSATWDVTPYFLGSDSIYAVAWLTLAIAGDGGVWVLADRWRGAANAPLDEHRRATLLWLGGAVAAIWALGLLPRSRTLSVAALNPAASPTSSTATPGPTAANASPSAAATGATPSATATPSQVGVRIGSLSDLRSQGSLTYQDPKSGDPALAIDLGNNRIVSYDAVCTHAGCTVQYDPPQKLMFCPCHGAVFDPAQNAAVLQGPAPTPLAPLQVTVGLDGNVYTAG
jgi:thiosulfate dehydrogenase [quinone] large subunit